MAQSLFVAGNCSAAIAAASARTCASVSRTRAGDSVNSLPCLSLGSSKFAGGLACRSPSLVLLRNACNASVAHSSRAPKSFTVRAEKGTEDGIFGTSGGFGFTKQNELFVGRLAMLGFAASLLGEAVTGKGICAQLGLETGIPLTESEPLIIFFIVFNVLGAIGALGDRGRFVDEKTGLERALISPGKGLKSALGLSETGPTFGFTKANELFVGRIAQLGFVASILGEVITGKGALAQLNIETGVPISEIEPFLLFFIVFFFIAAVFPGTGKFVIDEEE
eukprot:TRINITY_DN34_c0_g1_i1.p1 TRINITY_DN34_c0_g1~~TRINITY_DN34_c0_g1_i1.p1  ORF type:complete len:279 (-),score=34.24 TRINITY_DN34_c0_g1_i1:386-1222(-)